MEQCATVSILRTIGAGVSVDVDVHFGKRGDSTAVQNPCVSNASHTLLRLSGAGLGSCTPHGYQDEHHYSDHNHFHGLHYIRLRPLTGFGVRIARYGRAG